MKQVWTAFSVLQVSVAAPSDEAVRFPGSPGKPITPLDLKVALPAPWTVSKGKWEAGDRVPVASDKGTEHHAAPLWHQVPDAAGGKSARLRNVKVSNGLK